jgi:hypothetical protein
MNKQTFTFLFIQIIAVVVHTGILEMNQCTCNCSVGMNFTIAHVQGFVISSTEWCYAINELPSCLAVLVMK